MGLEPMMGIPVFCIGDGERGQLPRLGNIVLGTDLAPPPVIGVRPRTTCPPVTLTAETALRTESGHMCEWPALVWLLLGFPTVTRISCLCPRRQKVPFDQGTLNLHEEEREILSGYFQEAHTPEGAGGAHVMSASAQSQALPLPAHHILLGFSASNSGGGTGRS